MIIDRSHKTWMVASASILAASAVLYVPYALGPGQPGGGTPLGLAYGVAGFAGMAFVTLLALRKKSIPAAVVLGVFAAGCIVGGILWLIGES